jgi:hypothetical protein
MAWDLHNEPDHYGTWEREDGPARVLTWLSRMASQVKRLAPNHLVTVGMGQYQHMLLPGPDGQRVIDYSDFISLHNYNAPDARRQIDELRQHTDRPIVLGEFGWPSGPTCALQVYNEDTQGWVYRTMLEQVAGQVAGIVAWTLRDFDAGPTRRWDTREEYYGLYRPDDSLKPAAEPFAAWPAAPLPAATQSNLVLTQDNIHPPGGAGAPRLVAESEHYIKGWFRIAWDEMGGRGFLGLPLSEAFVQPDTGIVRQYFEAAVLEYDPDSGSGSELTELSRSERARRLIRVVEIGNAYTQGRSFPQPETVPPDARFFSETGYAVAGDFLRFYEGAYGEWRLGAPLSQEVTAEIAGVPTTVQYFQRGSLERDPATRTALHAALMHTRMS